MIRSMTGYGRSELQTKSGLFTVEIKTLNHKFLEITPKLPNSLAIFDEKVKTLIKDKIKRGKIYFNLTHDTSQEFGANVYIDEKIARSYYNKLRRLKRGLKLDGSIQLSDIISFPGVINYKLVEKNITRLWPCVRGVINEALERLVNDREREGSQLFKDLMMRIRRIRKILSVIKRDAASDVQSYKRKLAQRIKEFSGGYPVDKGRLEVEVALFAKNSDITEELIRLNNHIINFNRTIKKTGEAGKKLDFIAQEIHREINTLGSKSSGFNISKGVIEIKTEIEKVREQLKNIE